MPSSVRNNNAMIGCQRRSADPLVATVCLKPRALLFGFLGVTPSVNNRGNQVRMRMVWLPESAKTYSAGGGDTSKTIDSKRATQTDPTRRLRLEPLNRDSLGCARLTAEARWRNAKLALESPVERSFRFVPNFGRYLGDTATAGSQHPRSKLKPPAR
jgi:hypothetical protein